MSVTDVGTVPRTPCGHEIGPDDPIYLWYETKVYGYSFGNSIHRGCLNCAEEALSRPPATLRSALRVIGGVERHVLRDSCPECGRVVIVIRAEAPPRGRRRAAYYCSEKCSHTRRLRTAREERARARSKVCEVCAQAYTATRRNAETCSPACRQRAYRQRRRSQHPIHPTA